MELNLERRVLDKVLYAVDDGDMFITVVCFIHLYTNRYSDRLLRNLKQLFLTVIRIVVEVVELRMNCYTSYLL
jgi:hypothetical protein